MVNRQSSILNMKKILLVSSIACVLFSCTQPSDVTTTVAESLVPDTTWTTKVEKTKEDWKNILTPAQFNITREQGTEIPFSSAYNHIKDTGVYYCVSCKNPLFSSTTKFDSGTGWPSFYAPYSGKSVS